MSLRNRLIVVPITALVLLIGVLPALAATATRANSSAIAIAASGAASPFPSTIEVGGFYGNVTDINVTLSGLSHEMSTDVVALLVGPAGQSVVLMDDAGGQNGRETNNVTLTFDDSAAATLPQDGVGELMSGTFRPTPAPAIPYSCSDTPAPAGTPAGPHGAALSVFNGTNPNGTWSLYVYDDCAFGSGAIAGGWSLKIAAMGPAVTVPADITVPNDPGQPGAVVTFTVTGVDHFNTPLTPQCSATSGTLFPIGMTTVSCMVTDENGREATDTFTVTVNDTEAPVVTVPDDITVTTSNPAGTSVTYTASATDNSGSANVVCDPPSGDTFPVGSTTVTCTATDAASNSDADSFTVTVILEQGPTDLLAQLRADTILLVSNSIVERSMVATLDLARSALDFGSTWLARSALLQYRFQLDFYISTRQIAPTDGQHLRRQLDAVIASLTPHR